MTTSSTFRRRTYNATGDGYESGRYGDAHMAGYRELRNQTLLQILRRTSGEKPLRILEVGCGTGLSLQYLGQLPIRHRLFGIDASDTMLGQAALKATSMGNPPRLALGDASRLPYSTGAFDVVFATRFMHQFPHEMKRQLWQEFQRVVRRDGLIILEFYARPYHWIRYYTGARKGKSHDAYFLHFPSRAEVEDIVGAPLQMYPLRLAGSRLLSGTIPASVMRRLTQVGGRAFGGLFLDEYFVAARRR